MAEFGDERAATAVHGALGHPNPDVRRLAVESLAKMVEKGNPKAIIAVCNLIEDRHYIVRWTAMRALGQVAEQGDRFALERVQEKLTHPSADVRRAAVGALMNLDGDWHHGSRHCNLGVCAVC